MTIDSSGDERDGSKGSRNDSMRRDAGDGDVKIVLHNWEDEFAKMLESDSDGNDDEAKVIEEWRKWRQHLLNAQRIEGKDGLRRTRSSKGEQREVEEDYSDRFEETVAAKGAATKGESQWKSLKSRGATGAVQVDMFAEADVAAEAAEVSNKVSLANVEHHAHLTDNRDAVEG